MHRNPVARGLVLEPEQWPWSSYRSYAFEEEGARGANQSVGQGQDQNRDASGMSSHLYKKRKGGPPNP